MPVRTLKNEALQSLGALTFVCERTGLPKIIASQWLSINESKYSKSYIAQNLYALNLLYEHFSKHPDLEDLDQTFISQDFSAINRGLRSFVSERQNISAIRGVEQSTTVQMACSILISVIEEFNVRTSNFGRNAQELQRSVSSIQVLHKFLRPPKKYRKKKIRSLPYTVIEEIFSLVHPESKRNPFRNEKIRHRNFVIVSILYLMGIRQGELLLLSTNSIKTEFDPESLQRFYWMDIHNSGLFDTRISEPSLKTNFSVRQIPVPDQLYAIIRNFSENYRGKAKHGFLFSSQKGGPLSSRALNEIFEKLSTKLSDSASEKLLERCKTKKITPHNFRHSAAVDRIRAYRHSSVPMDQAESLLREFFGWSPNSNMPRLYAKAFYEEQLNSFWHSKFDDRVSRMLNCEK